MAENGLHGDGSTAIENFIWHLENELEVLDYASAIKTIDQYGIDLYNEAGKHEKRIAKEQEEYMKFLEAVLDILLSLADTLFVSSPISKVDNWFHVEMMKCKAMIDNGNENAALEASGRLKNLVGERQNRIIELDKKGYYEESEFVLFWKLWKLLDDILKHRDFPLEAHDSFAASLYGAITPALLAKEGVMDFSRYYDKIFTTR